MTLRIILFHIIRASLPSPLSAHPPSGGPSQDGLTPLHWAAMRGHAEIVEALLEAGADKDAKTKVQSSRE